MTQQRVASRSGRPSGDRQGDRHYLLDELAAASRVPSRTLRYWQTIGVLSPPERAGRLGLYGEHHVRRAQLVRQLQARGLRLDAAASLAEHLDDGQDSAKEWLGLPGDVDGRPPRGEQEGPVVLRREELLERAGGDGSVLVALERMGLISRRNGADEQKGADDEPGWLAPSQGLLDLALRLAATGVDAETAVGAEALLRHRMRQVAEELIEWFTDRMPPVRNPRRARARFEALRPIGIDGARLILLDELNRAFQRTTRRPRPSAAPAGAGPAWLRWIIRRRAHTQQ